MTTVAVTLTLPEDIAIRAQVAGLLTSERIAEPLLAELERQRRVDEFFADIEKLHALQPPLTQEEIDEELRLARIDS